MTVNTSTFTTKTKPILTPPTESPDSSVGTLFRATDPPRGSEECVSAEFRAVNKLSEATVENGRQMSQSRCPSGLEAVRQLTQRVDTSASRACRHRA
jgi:hypothetical protein